MFTEIPIIPASAVYGCIKQLLKTDAEDIYGEWEVIDEYNLKIISVDNEQSESKTKLCCLYMR